MTDFTIYTMKSAPEAAQPLLEDSIASFGMIPNLHGVMAESPAVLLSYKFYTLRLRIRRSALKSSL